MSSPSTLHPALHHGDDPTPWSADPRYSATTTPTTIELDRMIGKSPAVMSTSSGAVPRLTASRSSSLGRRPSVRMAPWSMGTQDLGADYPRSPQVYGSPAVLARPVPSDRRRVDRSPSPPSRPSATSAMAETVHASKSPGLIRRFSRGASQKLRRRASNQQSLCMRDQSAGPVLVRRRSDSNGASDLAPDVSDLELDVGVDEAVDELPYLAAIRARNTNGLGIGRTSNASSHFEGGIAPATSAILQNGTWVSKLTTKKTKRLYMWLEPNAARVCWHPTNSAKSFFIDDVREVRVGQESRNMRDDIKIPEDREHLVVSLVCDMPQRSKGASIKTMHFLMPDEFVFGHWTDALSAVARQRIEVMNALSASTEKSERSMAEAWKVLKGPNTDQSFTLDDAKWMCRKLEINCSDHAVRTHFTICDKMNAGKLSYAQYKDFINSFKERKDIQNLYRNIKFGTDLDMDLPSFLEFLAGPQGVDVEKDRAHWTAVFERFARSAPNRACLPDADASVVAPRTMNMQGFQNFLTSSYNSPLAPSKAEASFDRPLNEYFISSSHNTYLLGRQVRGESSVEGYISALIKGCRCVEIDCWDGDNGRPMVTHGRTLTSRISFEDCVSVIAKYAFHTSPYPLVVSLEVHCNPEQQRAMVDLMAKYFDAMMVTEPITSDAVSLPSPEELRKKILIKVKAAEEVDLGHSLVDTSNGRSRARSLGSAAPFGPLTDNHAASIASVVSSMAPTSPSETTTASISTPRGSITSGPTNTPSTSSSDSDDALVPYEKPKRRKTSKIIPELGRLGVYTQGISYTGFNAPDAKTINHIYSFNESTFEKLCTKSSDTKTQLEKHNQRHLMRVYPAARRFDSSNFDPLQTWRRGVQMAALNWQTYDACQQINTAMFAAGSDHLGYVLKPDELRHAKHLPIADTIPGAPEKKERKGKQLVQFTVDVISAQRLPRPKSSSHSQDGSMNPYIVFEMYSAEDKAPEVARGEGGADTSAVRSTGSGIGSPLRKRTKIVEGNGFDPIYNESISMTVLTKYPGLIFVRWAVHNSPEARTNASTNSGPLAVFTAKLTTLQQGYRHLPLFNDSGEQYRDAKLFVRIRKEAPVPLQHDDDGDVAAAYEPSSLSAATAASLLSSSPRADPSSLRNERSWRARVFSRNPSQRRLNKERPQLNRHQSPAPNTAAAAAAAAADEEVTTPGPGIISRTSSMERDFR